MRIFTVLCFAFFSAQSFSLALPLPKGPRATINIPRTFTDDYDFEGIVRLSNCSGSLIRFEKSKDTDAAMVLTNGHCLETGFPAPGEFVYNKKSRRWFKLMKKDASTVWIQASRVIYSTMTKTDVTLYELNETYQNIQARSGIRPLTLESEHPTVGQDIEIISGYWERGYRCSIDQFIFNIKEEGYVWEDSLRYSPTGCEVIGGTSGSPIIKAGTRTVIAINNTGNENGERCTENNPCEVDKDGNVSVHQGINYGEETYQIYSCLNEKYEFDLTVPGCAVLGGAPAP